MKNADLNLGGWCYPVLTPEVLEGNTWCKMLAYSGGSIADSTTPELWNMEFTVS